VQWNVNTDQRMTKLLWLPILIILLGCSSANNPNLQIDYPNFIFDTIKRDQRIIHTFNLTNIGRKDLVISNIHTLCSCTVVFSDSIIIKPRETKSLRVQYNPSFYGDSGHITQKIALRTNTNKIIQFLSISGFVK